MSIEVKQMLIKSTVLPGQAASVNGVNRDQSRALSQAREDIMAECRQLIAEILREERER